MSNELHDRYASGVWGTRLRHAALAVLMAARGEPMTVRQVWTEIHRRHIVQLGLRRKDLADALRHDRAPRAAPTIAPSGSLGRIRTAVRRRREPAPGPP